LKVTAGILTSLLILVATELNPGLTVQIGATFVTRALVSSQLQTLEIPQSMPISGLRLQGNLTDVLKLYQMAGNAQDSMKCAPLQTQSALHRMNLVLPKQDNGLITRLSNLQKMQSFD
jgi:hypothetical protein